MVNAFRNRKPTEGFVLVPFSFLCSTLFLLLAECFQSSPLLLRSVWLCVTRREAVVCINANFVAHWDES